MANQFENKNMASVDDFLKKMSEKGAQIPSGVTTYAHAEQQSMMQPVAQPFPKTDIQNTQYIQEYVPYQVQSTVPKKKVGRPKGEETFKISIYMKKSDEDMLNAAVWYNRESKSSYIIKLIEKDFEENKEKYKKAIEEMNK